MKKPLLFLVIMQLSAFTAISAINDCFKVDNIWYRIIDEDNKKVCVIDNYYDNNEGFYLLESVIIPQKVNHQNEDYGVTQIESYAFRLSPNLKKVILNEGIITIESGAFSFCDLLSEITLPESLTTIKRDAFSGCSNLESIIIPQNVKEITDAFYNNNKLRINVDANNPYFSSNNGVLYNKDQSTLISYPSAYGTVILPENLKKIDSYAFPACENLNEVLLPQSLTDIGISAFTECIQLSTIKISANVVTLGFPNFSKCPELKNFTIDPNNNYISYENGLIYNKDKTTVIGSLSSIINMSDLSIKSGITTIGDYAFSENSTIKNVIIPETVTEMGKGAFSQCYELQKIQLSDNITSIKLATFSDCRALEDIVIPAKCKSIEAQAFVYCTSIKNLVFPDNVELLSPQSCVGMSKLESIHIGKGLKDIYTVLGTTFAGQNENYDMNLVSNSPNFKQITVDAGNPYMCSEDGVLYNKNKTELYIYPQAKEVSEYIVPDGVKTIRGLAFNRAILRSITFPASLENLKNSVITSSRNLTNITCNALTPPAVIDDNNERSILMPNALSLTVPAQSLSDYKNAPIWKEFKEFIPAGVNDIISDSHIKYKLQNNQITVKESANIQLYDMTGKIIDSKTLQAYDSYSFTTLNTGVYIAKIKYSDGNKDTVKFIRPLK